MNRQGKLDPSALEPGPFRGGKYHLGKIIGMGGFGVVYSATQVDLGRQVAIKFIKGRDPELHERFRREARLMATFRSLNVVKVHEFGVDDPMEPGQSATGVPYVVMEYVEGLTLHDWVHKHGPLSPLSAVTVLRQLLEVLAEARHLGVVHRDIKPQNIILTPPRTRPSPHVLQGQERVGDAVLLDFGIAGWTNTSAPSELTRTGATLGTLRYIAPECFSASDDSTQGQRSDHKTDLYALGLTTYFMLMGQEPFAELDQTQILRRQQDHAQNSQNPPLKLAFVDGPGLAEVINRLAHPDRSKRYDTAEEVLSHLESLSHSGVGFEAQSGAGLIPLDIQGMEQTLRAPAGTSGPRKVNFESIAPLGDLELHRQLSERLRPPQRPATPTASIAHDGEEEGEETPAETPRAHERVALRNTSSTQAARRPWIAPALALGVPMLLALMGWIAFELRGSSTPQPALAAIALNTPVEPASPTPPRAEKPAPVQPSPKVFEDANRAVQLAASMATVAAEALSAAGVKENQTRPGTPAKPEPTTKKPVVITTPPSPPKQSTKKEPAQELAKEAAEVKDKPAAEPASQPEKKSPEPAPAAPTDAPVKKKRKINYDHYLDI